MNRGQYIIQFDNAAGADCNSAEKEGPNDHVRYSKFRASLLEVRDGMIINVVKAPNSLSGGPKSTCFARACLEILIAERIIALRRRKFRRNFWSSPLRLISPRFSLPALFFLFFRSFFLSLPCPTALLQRDARLQTQLQRSCSCRVLRSKVRLSNEYPGVLRVFHGKKRQRSVEEAFAFRSKQNPCSRLLNIRLVEAITKCQRQAFAQWVVAAVIRSPRVRLGFRNRGQNPAAL